jgi:hypothetical protein
MKPIRTTEETVAAGIASEKRRAELETRVSQLVEQWVRSTYLEAGLPERIAQEIFTNPQAAHDWVEERGFHMEIHEPVGDRLRYTLYQGDKQVSELVIRLKGEYSLVE